MKLRKSHFFETIIKFQILLSPFPNLKMHIDSVGLGTMSWKIKYILLFIYLFIFIICDLYELIIYHNSIIFFINY